MLPWLAVAFGFGIVIYFSAEREPSVWAGTMLAGCCAVAAVTLRRHLVGFVVALFALAIAAGFAVATWKTATIAHPILHYSGIMAQTPQAL